MPIDKVLLGHSTASGVTLTAKQMKFAEEVAKGETKAEAYRKAYKSKGKPATQANEGYKLAQSPDVAMMIEAQKVALEAMKYQTPAHLRALTIHELTKHALDKAMPPAQRVKCLELLGKITEVALFTERREVVKVESKEVMREKLVQSIKLALSSEQAIDAEYQSADDLLAELKADNASDDEQANYVEHEDPSEQDDEGQSQGARAEANEESATPRTPDPLNEAKADHPHLHSIPHNGSPLNNDLEQKNI